MPIKQERYQLADLKVHNEYEWPEVSLCQDYVTKRTSIANKNIKLMLQGRISSQRNFKIPTKKQNFHKTSGLFKDVILTDVHQIDTTWARKANPEYENTQKIVEKKKESHDQQKRVLKMA